MRRPELVILIGRIYADHGGEMECSKISPDISKILIEKQHVTDDKKIVLIKGSSDGPEKSGVVAPDGRPVAPIMQGRLPKRKTTCRHGGNRFP